MAFVFGERVQETSTSVGLGPMTLLGALSGYQAFSAGIGQGNQTYYSILNEADDTWEVGIGTFLSGDLNRDSPLASSNSGAPVNFAVGNKRVFACVAAQFLNDTLNQATHSALDHTGLPGVPLPENFTATAHLAVNHTGPPFNLLNQAIHSGINHKVPPLNLIDAIDHNTINHTGLMGVNAFDALAHAAVIHSGIPGIPPEEAFTMAVHALTNHDGIPGIGATPAPDVAVEVAYASASSNNTTITNLSTNIFLPGGSNWTVVAWGAWMSADWPDANGDSILSVAGVVVSRIQFDVGGDAGGFEYYCQMGARSNLPPGSHSVTVTIPGNISTSQPRNARVVAIGLRQA